MNRVLLWLADPMWPRWRWWSREHAVERGGWRLYGTPDAIPLPRLRWGFYGRRDWWVTFEVSQNGSDPLVALGYQRTSSDSDGMVADG